MTEDEARKKWCPMVRYSHEMSDSGHNRSRMASPSPVPVQFRCIASDCMMWRWSEAIAGTGERLGYCGFDSAEAVAILRELAAVLRIQGK